MPPPQSTLLCSHAGLDFKNLATQYYTAKGGKVVSSVMFAGNSTTAHVEDLTKQVGRQVLARVA